MARSLDGTDIFRDDDDRRFFLLLLEQGIRRTLFRCYAWTLMSNHYHLLIRTSDQALSSFMRRLNSAYAAVTVNRKYDPTFPAIPPLNFSF